MKHIAESSELSLSQMGLVSIVDMDEHLFFDRLSLSARAHVTNERDAFNQHNIRDIGEGHMIDHVLAA